MRRVSNGYTIVEVMIFLAVSVVIAGATMRLISGQQAETEFNQKMRDTQSKIQDWINDVSTGNTAGDPQNQHCSTATGLPVIYNGAPASPPQCVFLGRAIQFTDMPASGSDKIFAYSVFGCHAVGCPISPTPTDVLPTTVQTSTPKAADGNPGLSLTETFDLSSVDVKSVKSVCFNGACTAQSHLIGFYNSLNTQNASTSTGAEDIEVYGFQQYINYPKNDPQIGDCLKLLSPCTVVATTNNPPALSSYTVCFTDSSSRTAEITITSAAGIGASTDLVYTSC